MMRAKMPHNPEVFDTIHHLTARRFRVRIFGSNPTKSSLERRQWAHIKRMSFYY